jgi:hypothetical protein
MQQLLKRAWDKSEAGTLCSRNLRAITRMQWLSAYAAVALF